MNLFKSYFDSIQICVLLLGTIFFVISLVLFNQKKYKLSVGALIVLAFCVYSFAALLDPFLNLWDERFHALVGKNMMDDPFKPMLYKETIVNMAYDRWDRYHIWLHKQPLFLWQIALSFKLFGVSEFTLRLPNVVLASCLVVAFYRSGKLLVNERTGYFAAILLCSSIYFIELVSGRQELDQNDFSFLAYVSFSIWAFIEYIHTGKKYWIYLIGIFSGMAILVKWLVGLLVFLGWAIYSLVQHKYKVSQNLDLLKSLLCTLIIALPWQIYTFVRFPKEAKLAYKFNTSHFVEPMDGHSGDYWYHFDKIDTIYGEYASIMLIPSLVLLYFKINNKSMYFSLVGMLISVYLFFTLAVTKMPSFTIVVALIVYLAFATTLDWVLSKIQFIIKKQWLVISLFSFVCILLFSLRFDIEALQVKHTTWKQENQYSRMLMQNKRIFTNLNLPENTVLFNVKGRHYIEAMFYTGCTAYNFIPDKKQYLFLKRLGRHIAIFEPDNDRLPTYLKSDSSVIIIPESLNSCD